jgi:hypothetical protein
LATDIVPDRHTLSVRTWTPQNRVAASLRCDIFGTCMAVEDKGRWDMGAAGMCCLPCTTSETGATGISKSTLSTGRGVALWCSLTLAAAGKVHLLCAGASWLPSAMPAAACACVWQDWLVVCRGLVGTRCWRTDACGAKTNGCRRVRECEQHMGWTMHTLWNGGTSASGYKY